MQRDNNWLQEQMFYLWDNNFADVPRKNLVLIKFGKKSKRQLGSIKWVNQKTKGIKNLLIKQNQNADDNRISLITVTNFFKDPKIPDFVILATIAHEMCHYAHGFNSPLKQQFNHPHKGGVIRKELEKRDLGHLYKNANKWLKNEWLKYLLSN